MIDRVSQTICAISTAPGVGGIAVVRVSGKDAITITDRIFKSPNAKKTLISEKGATLHFGTISDSSGSSGKEIDEVVVSLFRSPASFTGEDVVEISCHGSTFIQQKILEVLIEQGATMATPGEFTQRAFINGKMDLSQAEAVADLIASSGAASHKMALNQMRGGFSKELTTLRGELLTIVTMIELELDFGEEEVEFADRTELLNIASKIEEAISKLIGSFKLGNVIKNGIPVAIVGETNVGKSTLLNVLLNEDRAIVSDIAGTTRDVIEDTINLEGYTFRFIDTAGIRSTTDTIESIGIERAYQKVEQAAVVLYLIDITRPIESNLEYLESVRSKMNESQQLIIVCNKADIAGEPAIRKVIETITLADNEEVTFISAKERGNISHLNSLLLESIDNHGVETQDVIVSNTRHYEALKKANEATQRVIDGLSSGISSDFVSQDIRECMHYLGEITGDISTDEVLGNIFANFCIGK